MFKRPWPFRVAVAIVALLVLPVSVRRLPAQDATDERMYDAMRMVSGGLYYTIAMRMGLIPIPTETAPGAPAPTPPQPPTNINITSSAVAESEPAVLTTRVGGVTYSISTYHRFDIGQTIYFSQYNHSTGMRIIGQLPLVLPTYPTTVDPFLDINVYSGSYYNRIYNVGSMHNHGAAPFAIGCWRSSDQGATWAAPTLVATSTDPEVWLDKPAVVVSPASNSLGWVYVIYTVIDSRVVPTIHQIYVSRSTNGGATFSTPVQVDAGQGQGGQVVVDAQTGTVYAIWSDFVNNRLEASSSNDFGSTWTAAEVVATATYKFIDGDIGDGIRAHTLPMARLNKSTNRITVVWHEAECLCSRTDVYSATRTPTGWRPKVRVNDVTTNDQFMPSVDFDSSGNGRVTFYDRREDPTNTAYKLYRVKVDGYGAPISTGLAVSNFASIAHYYVANFIGDYQQTWWANIPVSYPFVASFIGNPTLGDGFNGDVWLAYFY